MDSIYKKDFKTLPPSVLRFLQENQLMEQLEQLAQRSKSLEQFQRNFNFWLDGFKVLKYVHFARDRFYGQKPLLYAAEKMLTQKFSSEEELLFYLRKLDRDSPFRYF